MTLVGIENKNEFFTQHYLTAILQGELRPVLERWRASANAEDGAQSTGSRSRRQPPQALAASQQALFRYLDRMEHEPSLPARVAAHFEIFTELLGELGYADVMRHSIVELPSGHIPFFGEIRRADGSPSLWVIPVVPARDSTLSTLSTSFAREQLAAASAATSISMGDLRPTGERTAEEIVNEAFCLEEPPRFVLVLGLDDIVLVERAKWAEQRLLRFDLREILGRRQTDTLDVTAALLYRDSLVPMDGTALIDSLDDSSHKHAFEVSEDLKYALQASIERLGNAAVDYIRRVKKQKVFGGQGENEELAEKLSRECLRYMYRLLFLFYIEARPELGYVPMGVDAYRLGYSLERLRDLEQADLSTDEARNGTYIHRSLRLLFEMIFDGRKPVAQSGLAENEAGELAASHFSMFELAPLRSHLFDPGRTPLLDGGSYKPDGGVVFSNEVLRDVIENMSLTRPGKGRRGRISYATLGINQLGAVYEALLSFRGFLAKTDLFEVKPEGSDDHDVLETAYFVPEQDLSKYSEQERVYDGDKLKRYPKGSFIYRLAGRDRQTSASYYTPEALTRATVKYALKELLEDESGGARLTADEILRLTVCEPAMGSAAFLNEAVNQIAEAYLSAKQRELGERIPHDKYAFEKQRVKMFIADNNVFGVDLNPIAVELAEVSLWLNTIHEGGFVPWFTGQTVCGNSLVGARRQVFPVSAIRAGEDGKQHDWLDTIPERVPLGAARPADSVYHFLLGDRSMSVYGRGLEGAPIREMAKEALERIDEWRADFCAPLEDDETSTMVRLSDIVDALWERHADLLSRIRSRTTDPIQIYGQPPIDETRRPSTTADKDRIWAQEMLSESVRASSPYRRLKLVMDYWCALWFWPIEQNDLLPERDEFLADIGWILDTHVISPAPEPSAQRELFAATAPDESKQLAMEYGFVDVTKLVAGSPRLQLVEKLAQRYRFLHWELEFADIFKTRGGFDLLLGNPPWLPVQWSEADVLGDADPSFVLKKLSAKETADLREETFARLGNRSAFLAAHEAAGATASFLGSQSNYPLLEGVKTNLYKCFLPLVWTWGSKIGTSGLLHPEKVFDEPTGGRLRAALYLRLRRHYQFSNELELFAEVHHQLKFSVNVYGPPRTQVRFEHIANLLTPSTIDSCVSHSGAGPVPGLKDDRNEWCVAGHRDRVLLVDTEALRLFADLYDEPGTPAEEARLPALHANQLIPALTRLRAASRVGGLSNWDDSFIFNETYAQKDGTIRRETTFPASPSYLVLTGPIFYVANPFYKSPRETCTQNSHYDVIDHEVIGDNYLPRTNYVPGVPFAEFLARVPTLSWSPGTAFSSVPRVVVPKMIGPAGERTLQPALIPPGVTHVHSVNSYAFARVEDLLAVAASWSSVVSDFFVKLTGTGNFQPNMARQLPVPQKYHSQLFVRVLLLNCLTSAYGDIWASAYREEFCQDHWTKVDPRLAPSTFAALRPSWTHETPLRNEYARRQALVEIDTLAAMSFGMSLDELRLLYRSLFYVMNFYESDTWYDRRGRIVFTNSKGLVGVGLPRTARRGDLTPAWEDVKDMKSGTVDQTITDDTRPRGPRERTIVYEAPFDRCDRERDYEVAWAHFEKRFGVQS